MLCEAVRRFGELLRCYGLARAGGRWRPPLAGVNAITHGWWLHKSAPLRLHDEYASSRATAMQHGGWRALVDELATRGVISRKADAFGVHGITLVDCIEHRFMFGQGSAGGPLKQPWAGVAHFMGDLPAGYGERDESLEAALTSPTFVRSLPHCLFLVALSRAGAAQVRALAPGVPVFALLHPAPSGVAPFNFSRFEGLVRAAAASKHPAHGPHPSPLKVVLVGSQYRRVETIYKLRPPPHFARWWLPGRTLAQARTEFNDRVLPALPGARFVAQLHHAYDMLSPGALRREERLLGGEVAVRRLSNAAYDGTLNDAVVVLDLVAASANNAVLECMAAYRPCVVSRLPALEEYLGHGYPLFFSGGPGGAAEVDALLRNTSRLLDLAHKAHHYLEGWMARRSSLQVGTFAARLSALKVKAAAMYNQIARQSNGNSKRRALQSSGNTRATEPPPESTRGAAAAEPVQQRSPPPLVSSKDAPAAASSAASNAASNGRRACAVVPTTLPAHCHAEAAAAVRVAVGFYGFAGRSLPHTWPGIEGNLLAPLRAASAGALDIFVHAMTADTIETKHFVAEHSAACTGFVDLLAPCVHEAADQAEVDRRCELDARVEATRARSEGVLHRYNDGPTLLNIYRSRYSLSRVGKLIGAHELRSGFRHSIAQHSIQL
jgi:hypothetical protein